jgi:hypothetical protein
MRKRITAKECKSRFEKSLDSLIQYKNKFLGEIDLQRMSTLDRQAICSKLEPFAKLDLQLKESLKS